MTTTQTPCFTCRATGRILVGNGRGELLVCPACRGTGEQPEARR